MLDHYVVYHITNYTTTSSYRPATSHLHFPSHHSPLDLFIFFFAWGTYVLAFYLGKFEGMWWKTTPNMWKWGWSSICICLALDEKSKKYKPTSHTVSFRWQHAGAVGLWLIGAHPFLVTSKQKLSKIQRLQTNSPPPKPSLSASKVLLSILHFSGGFPKTLDALLQKVANMWNIL